MWFASDNRKRLDLIRLPWRAGKCRMHGAGAVAPSLRRSRAPKVPALAGSSHHLHLHDARNRLQRAGDLGRDLAAVLELDLDLALAAVEIEHEGDFARAGHVEDAGDA